MNKEIFIRAFYGKRGYGKSYKELQEYAKELEQKLDDERKLNEAHRVLNGKLREENTRLKEMNEKQDSTITTLSYLLSNKDKSKEFSDKIEMSLEEMIERL